MTKTLRALAALSLALLALAGCGSTSGSGSDPASLAPQTSFLYAEATIDPQGSQEGAVRSILADLPGTGAPQDRLENLIRKAIRGSDEKTKVDWDKDIKPWLGDKVAGFVAAGGQGLENPPAALVVATTDADAARAALEKDKEPSAAHRRYKDVEYVVESDNGDETARGVVDDFYVEGNDAGMKAAIDASKSKTLSDSDRFKQATGDLPDGRIGFAYADLGGLLQLAAQAAGNEFPAGALFGRLIGGKPLVITARAENQALIFEGKGSLPGAGFLKSNGDSGALMESLPARSWAAVSIPGFGDGIRALVTGIAGALGGEQQLREQLRQATGLDLERDLLSWIGDVGLFAGGDSVKTIGGGALIRSKDPASSKRALTKIGAAIAKSDPSTQVSAARIPGAFGYRVSDSDAPRGLFMVQRGDRVALTYGEDQARAALGEAGLSGDPDFKRAADGLGDGWSPAIYVSVPPILRLADSAGASSDKDYEEARPYLTILDYLVAGSADGHGRLRIGFKPHD